MYLVGLSLSTDSVIEAGKEISRVRPFVRLFLFYFLNQLTFYLDLVQVYGQWP